MSSITGYLKNWCIIVRDVAVTPRKFFRDMPRDTDLNKPFMFALVTIFFTSLLSAFSVLFIFFPGPTLSWLASPSLDNTSLITILILFGIFMYSFFSSLISLPVYAGINHVLLKICGGHGDIKDTFRVSCYYMAISVVMSPVAFVLTFLIYATDSKELESNASPLLFIPVILIILAIAAYCFYVLFVGFSLVHGISITRVFAGVIGIPSVVMLLFFALIVGLLFITGYSSSTQPYNRDNPIEYERPYATSTPPNISAPYGTAPQIDGYYTSDDIWAEADPKYFSSSGVNYTLAAKHDGMMLYILIRWKGGQEWDNPLSLHFEQDGLSHDHDFMTGRNDEKYNGVAKYGPNSFYDAHYEGGVREQEDGMVRGNYKDGYWVQEWVVPLRSGDPADIYVNELPATLGFAVMPGNGYGSIWPPGNADRYEPETWGNINILDSYEIKLTPQPTRIVTAVGKAPLIDGRFTPEDGWDNTGRLDLVSSSADYYTIAAKHDRENLYILVKWIGEPYYTSAFIVFEQDGTSHDHDLGTGRNDMKHNSASNYYFDAHGKMEQNEEQNGIGRSNYSNQSWVYEYSVPLCSGDKMDICVEKFPSTLGFMLEVGNENIFWPHNASRDSSEFWGDLELIDRP